MIISKIALCAVAGAVAVLAPVLADRGDEPAPKVQPVQVQPVQVQPVQVQPHPPSGGINRIAQAFPP